MVEEVGKYNVDYAGKAYDNESREYSLIIISEFVGNKEVARKVFYFFGNVPKFHNEQEIDEIFSFPNYSQLQIKHYLTISRTGG